MAEATDVRSVRDHSPWYLSRRGLGQADATKVTMDRLQRSLFDLCTTADLLEARSASVAVQEAPVTAAIGAVPDPRPAVVVHASRRRRERSAKQLVWSTARHTAATIAVLVAIGAVADPVLPRPAGPDLGAPEHAQVDDGTASPIPPPATNRP